MVQFLCCYCKFCMVCWNLV